MTIDKNLPIGIFDSGVGGLSILHEIKKLLPNENFLYIADQKNVPYGEKTEDELKKLTSRIVEFLLENEAKIIIIACNSATVYTIDYLRSKFDMPIVGTVPAIKTLTKVTKTGNVGILATPATSKSKYLKKLCSDFATELNIHIAGATHLEDLVEEGNLERKEIAENLRYNIPKLTNYDVDAIALGCTHYPFLRDKIENIAGQGVAIVDSGEPIAKQTKKILKEKGLVSSSKIHEDLYFTTGDIVRFKRVAEELLGKTLKNVEKVNI